MGRIKKAAGPKHEATVSPAIADFVSRGATIAVSRLPSHLRSFPPRWPFPRGDLYHWIPLLNRFDSILEAFSREYGLHDGPQTRPFERLLLERGVAEDGKPDSAEKTSLGELDTLGYSMDGDKHLVQAVLQFSCELIQSCGNRSLYSSSERLGELLNTTDLSLLSGALELALLLAQRYHASRQRSGSSNQHLSSALLASHYNIDLETVQRLANPFSKTPLPSGTSSMPITIATHTKGKEKARQTQSYSVSTVHPCDLLKMISEEISTVNGSADMAHTASAWDEWGDIQMRYYHAPSAPRDSTRNSTTTSPTPTRRPSNLSRPSRLSSSDDSPESSVASPMPKLDDDSQGGMRTIEIPFSRLSNSATIEILKDVLPDLPKDSQYELLTRMRIASAMTGSQSTRQKLVAVRLLALTNLAYIYPENHLQQRILQQDSDEPRRLQLAYQLADLIHHPGNRKPGVPVGLQTVALGTLEALTKHKAKAAEVCAALNINVNHGVLLHALKKTAADMGIEDVGLEDLESERWRDALFSLLEALPTSSPRTGEALIGAGLFDILIDILGLRTIKAERHQPKILAFLNTIVYTARDAFQTLANAKGLDAISDLIAFEVSSSLQRAKNGQGIPVEYRNQMIDYQIPYAQQQTLRWLFKFVNHMMSHGGGNFDRLLRNLIDSPQLLGGLQTVIINAHIFGSSVWSGGVNILSSFIHNEPTSYGIIAEAGLSKGFLESVASEPVSEANQEKLEGDDGRPPTSIAQIEVTLGASSTLPGIRPMDITAARPQERRQGQLAKGILPATDAIVTIPQAFGAICLNNSGLELFLRSKALEKFFEIFESQEHVKSMTVESELPRMLGSSFDELVRHHPQLKKIVMASVMLMIARVSALCRSRATIQGLGAKLWTDNKDGLPEPAGGFTALVGEPPMELVPTHSNPITREDSDVVMTEADARSEQENVSISFESLTSDTKAEEFTPSLINVTMKFLAGFFENTNLCSAFVEAGGAESVLDFALLPSLQYDFNNEGASQEVSRVVHMLVEQKPHLVVPSLIKRTQDAVDVLQPLCDHNDSSAYFAKYTTPNQPVPEDAEKSLPSGTRIVKNLVIVHTLCNILFETFSPPIYNARSSHTIFSQVNLTDMYVSLVKSLGRLHRICVWEEILLQNTMPDSWKEATKVKGYGMGSQEADDVFGLIVREDAGNDDDDPIIDLANDGSSSKEPTAAGLAKRRQSSLRKDENTSQFQNVRVLRYLLSQLPSSIVPFFQGLGKALIAKRRPDPYARQSAYTVAEAMSAATLEQLRFEAPKLVSTAKDRYSYWIVILTSISQLLIEGPIDHPQPQCLTLVLQTFKNAGGLLDIKDILEIFLDEVKPSSKQIQSADMTDAAARLATAYGGTKIILNLYTQITTSKIVMESTQTTTLQSSERDRGHAHYFLPSQFLVELRMAVLPVVRSIWDSNFVDQASSPIVKSLIEILRIGLESGDENGSFKRGDKLPAHTPHRFKAYHISEDRVKSLADQGFDAELAREALYRCYSVHHAAEEYCLVRQKVTTLQRYQIPEYEQEKNNDPAVAATPQHHEFAANSDPERTESLRENSAHDDVSSESPASALLQAATALVENAPDGSTAPPPAPGVPGESDGAMSIGNLLNLSDIIGGDLSNATQTSTPDRATPSTSQTNLVPIVRLPGVVTVNDLDDERSSVRENLIERALDVLNAHDDVTFELADLIHAAAVKAPDGFSMRRDIGMILVQSLISLQLDDDFRPAGKKIAAYANLLGLVLQDEEFYQATLEELKGNFSQLLGFIKVFPDQKPEESSPWIGQVLLIIEKVLSDDAQPAKIQWTPPSVDSDLSLVEIASIEAPIIPREEKRHLFGAVVDILPRIGKDESLALSVVRVLVILTRNRGIAITLAEKKNIQRLFVMIKQLSGITNERLQSSYMLILRHIVEDDDTVRQIMRSEILQNFETRPNRPTDTTTYVRQMYQLILRSPELFVEITNEKLEIRNYESSSSPSPQYLSLKPDTKDESSPEDNAVIENNKVEGHKESSPQAMEGVKPSTEDNKAEPQKPKLLESRPPMVEHPSGVIHYILSELSSYREVDDKDPLTTKRTHSETGPQGVSLPNTASSTENASTRNADTEGLWLLAEAANLDHSSVSTAAESDTAKKPEKQEFKADQHPIYVYRCFLLQCLTELLHSYNRTKIEFINFSRKADPKAVTPSKPRSGVLNYLLSDLVPVGTLNHEETVAFRKKSTTSSWAMAAIVALCLKTNEYGYEKRKGSLEEEEDTDLLFVRKFVLEHALKAYRDANSSDEPLDVKYARLLSLADLFERLLQGNLGQISPTDSRQIAGATAQKQIAKIMFDKNFISALTNSIADVDLNFPQSKRAVKHILRPIKQLTSTAIHLSQTSSISSVPDLTDYEEISTASSVSEMDDEREETPDLFRNSTLGMFEPGREEESSSESSDDDEDMYEDEYEDGMEYEEDMERDGEVISDEDEEIEGAGHIEGLHGDTGMDVEVVIDGDEEGSSVDDDDEDDEEGSENTDAMEDAALEAIEEISGNDNNSLGDGDNEEEWQDEDELDRDRFGTEEDAMGDPSQPTEDPSGAGNAMRDIMRELSGGNADLQHLEDEGALDILEGEAFPEDQMPEAEDGNDDDDDEGDDDELVYQPNHTDDEPGMFDPPWGWDPDDEHGMPPPRAHHPRRVVSPWAIFPTGHPSDRGNAILRSHRPTGAPRAADDGMNPLLHRNGRNISSLGGGQGGRMALSDAAASLGDFWVHGMEPGLLPRGPTAADSPVSFVNNIIAAIGQAGPSLTATTVGGPQGGALHLHIGGAPGSRHGALPRELQALLGLRQPPQELTRPVRDDSNQTTTFSPRATYLRWQEEARLLFGNSHVDKAQRIVNSLLQVLVPPAVARKKREDEEARREMEAREKVLEEERRIKEEQEKAEKEAQEQKEREEREEREAAAAAAAERERQTAQAETEPTEEAPHEDDVMEGVETTQTDESVSENEENEENDENVESPPTADEPAEAGSSAPTERVRTTIRGRDLDITGMGVDLEYLEALPEDLREEVLMHQLAQQRSQAVAAGEEPTDISREFLEALPPDIREELLQQEAQDRRRREREEERRRRATEGGAPARAEEMDPASFLASLDPGLRQAVLMDQDEEVLAHLPSAIAAEARALGVDRGYHGYRGVPQHHRNRITHDREARENQQKKQPRKQIVQMLDKAGVATLLRLMFMPQSINARQSLNNILHDISQNRQTRSEVLSLLLSILQDGSTDVSAVERSFAHLSLRAKQPATQKTPQPLKRALTGPVIPATNSEMTPLMVVQQCLSALVFLTQYNPHIPSFFLAEHEVSSGLRSRSSRKGKGKETRAQKFALNALLSLLDRKLIMESSSCMEQLSCLLQAVTHPLTMLLKKEKESAESSKKTESTEAAETAATESDNQVEPSDPPPVESNAIDTNPGLDEAAEASPNGQQGTVSVESTNAATAVIDVKPNEEKKQEEDKSKRTRNLVPPVVPEENLRLVVNILAARECNGKTFRDTLSTINNLSAIPEAKEVFGRGLIEQARDLGQSILADLDELVPQIREAESGTDVQGMALARFSPASSDQAKLLRVLTALDYLFDPKRNNGKTKPAESNNNQENGSPSSSDDILTALYENPTFGALWEKLSECLGAIRQGDGMLNIATILLPLIEALMVVCKNTTLKDAPLVKATREVSIVSPPPESGIENLFFRFTEDHRKILNDLVRHNPKLMSGTFSLLVKNPKVLEFDNKRNYFNRRLHSRGTEARHPQPPLQLSVRRDQVFLDSYKTLYFKTGDEIKYGKLSIRFHGEEGVDAGGVTREWFQVLSRQMFNPDYALFVPVASDRTTFHPNKLSTINEEHLLFFKFIGRIIGKALYEGRALDCHFSRAVYKRILGKSVSIKDMETLDLDYYKSLVWMLENDITEIITETFAVETDDFGITQVVDLIENGRNIPVTEENKYEYVQLVVEYRLTGSVQAQLEQFLGGFHDIVSPELISIFNEQELELLISGLPDIDVDDWKNHTEYHNYSASSSQIQWFWRAVRSFDKEERAKLLQFVTGTSKVPLNGFGQLEGMNGFSRFNIHRDYGNKDRLPSSHTCFNQLDLPEYDSYEALRQQVYTAMTAGSEYFGFA